MGGTTHHHRPKKALFSSKARPFPPDEETQKADKARLGLSVYSSYPHSAIYTPPEQIGPKDGAFELTGMVIHSTPCSQCGMQLQASAPRIVAARDLLGESEGGRASTSFLHMHIACAPSSLLESACDRYSAHRLADLPGFSASPNRPLIAQLLSRKMSRFHDEGFKRKTKARQPKKKEEIRKFVKAGKKAAKVGTVMGVRMTGRAAPGPVKAAAAAEAKRVATKARHEETKVAETETKPERGIPKKIVDEVKVREAEEHKTAY